MCFARKLLHLLGALCLVGAACAETNLALGRPVFATGPTYPGYPASNLTDGTAETFAHPNLSSGTLGFYFEIDLGAIHELERIVLTGRGDGCCIQRLSRYQVEIRADNGGQAGAVNWVGIMRADGSYPVAGGSDTVEAADGTGTFAGRFVRIVNVSDDLYNPQVAEVVVNGVPGPEIRLFAASAGNITAGGNPGLPTQTALSWETLRASSLTISPAVGTVSGPNGSVTLQPAVATTYTLTATRGAASVQATLTIGVDAPFSAPVINEFVADNDGLIEDEDGENSDWIEIRNPNSFSLNLKGAHLTDKSNQAMKWTFPDAMVAPGGYLVVFASSKDRALAGRPLHTNFSLAQEGEYLGLRAPGGTPVWSAFSPTYPVQKLGISYGRPGSGAAGYLVPSTPGAENPATAKVGFVAEPVFSSSRGFYSAPRNVALSCATAGATIRYTTNGTMPTETTGTVYPGTLTLSANTVLRAAAFKANFVPSRVETNTYLFLTGVIGSGVMRTSITQHPTYGPQMNSALRDLPSMSLVVPGTLDGDIETACSIEYLDPAVTTGGAGAGVVTPQANAGVKYFGGAFTDFEKKNFRLAFRGSYGDSKLDGDLFPDRRDGWLPAGSFDSIELRSGSHDMWMRGFYLSNPFTDQILGEMGHMQPHGRMVHLYLNGVYHGIYHLRERWGAAMAQSYLVGGKEDYESINGNLNVGGWADPGTIYDGDGSAWARIKEMRSDYPAIAKHVDVENYLDFMVMWMFGNAENEYRASGAHREDGGSGMKIMLNDADGWLSVNQSNQISAWDGNDNNTARAGVIPGKGNGDGPASLLSAWLASGGSDFKIRLADRIQRHLGPGGALSATSNAARLTTMADAFVRPHLAESARWNFRTPDNWNGARDVCLQSWIPNRTQTVLTQFRNAGFFPATAAPVLTPSSGALAAGGLVSVAGSGTLYYTRDGSDPRLPGGLQNPAAQAVATGGTIAMATPTRLKVRARSAGGEWSALTEAFFVPQGGSALPPGSVVVSELSYDAEAGGAEFVELLNVSAQAVNLRGASFTMGIEYAFSNWRDMVLQPGGRMTIVDSDFSFRDRYGWEQGVAGVYRGNLASEGERLILMNAGGGEVFDFTWNGTWEATANGGGHTLVLLAGATNLSSSASWSASIAPGGNPNGHDLETYAGGNPDGDDDGDGISNFTHYALAGNGPLRLPEITVTEDGVRWTIYTNVIAADAEVTMQTSDDLTAWQPMTDVVLVEQQTTAGIRRAVWELPAGDESRFVRLRVMPR
jgi:hypothetical protein